MHATDVFTITLERFIFMMPFLQSFAVTSFLSMKKKIKRLILKVEQNNS